MKTKTRKTPSVGFMLILSICAKCHGSVVKSQLLRHSHATRHNHCMVQAHRRKNLGFSSLKNNSALVIEHQAMRSRFFSKAMFFLSEKESLKGITILVVRLSGCLHTSRIKTNIVSTLIRVSFSERGF